MRNEISIVDPTVTKVPTTEKVESCDEGYKLAEPAIEWTGNGIVYYQYNQQTPPADVTYDHKRYNYIKDPTPSGHVCIKEISSKKGHE